MTYGISTVFIFLCLLIAAMSLMSSLVSKLPDEQTKQPIKEFSNINYNVTNIDITIVKVLQAAITEHRNRKSV